MESLVLHQLLVPGFPLNSGAEKQRRIIGLAYVLPDKLLPTQPLTTKQGLTPLLMRNWCLS